MCNAAQKTKISFDVPKKSRNIITQNPEEFDVKTHNTDKTCLLYSKANKMEKTGVISDNGSRLIAGDFKEFIRLGGMTHVRTSPCYPQSSGKIERRPQGLKKERIRPGTPLNLDDAGRLAANFVDYYNSQRLHSSPGYITPNDKLQGRENQIFAERDRKLEAARQAGKQKRLTQRAAGLNTMAALMTAY